jgi:DedD protein
MPPPSSENDLKRLARRRLIGAVALTLLAVIVLPLLLEDEPPPASSLAVRMSTQEPVPEQAPLPIQTDDSGQPAAPEPPVPSVPAPQAEAPRPAPKPEPAKAAAVKPAPAPQPAVKPAPQAKHAAGSEVFVVQLAALSDSDKASSLKARAVLAGLPAYTDKVGALTRVRVGPYASREDAVAAAEKLAENGMSGQVLTK